MGIKKLPMIYNLTGSIVNISFHYLLIYGNGKFLALGLRGGACNAASTALFGRCLGEWNAQKGRAYLRLIVR